MGNDDIIYNPEQLTGSNDQHGKIQTEPPETTPSELNFRNELKQRRILYGILKTSLVFLLSVVSAFLLFLFVIYAVPALQEIPSGGKTHFVKSAELIKSAPYKKQITLMNRDIDRLSTKYNSYTTGQSYLVINTTDNLFYLYKNKKLIREGHCSSGSYIMLKTESGKSWVFKTPKGKFMITGKRTNPAWHRSDWSFIEEGSPVPPKDSPLRWEYNVLGDYAMDLRDGYMIHGTIWKRLLGMPVTHGCVRLNDEDLKVVFNSLSIGSKVYIF
jgi:hypothetical protein